MKKTLIIGSTTADMVVNIPQLPTRMQDVNAIDHQLSLGGCAFNISCVHHLLQADYLLLTPQGTGYFGDFVRKELAKQQRSLMIERPEKAGVCLCLVEPDGERSFIADHGIEYHFQKEWIKDLDLADINAAYICGLEIEDCDGDEIISFLSEHQWQVYFAPGPRICEIPAAKMQKIFSISPIIHLNEDELSRYSHCGDILTGCEYLYKLTHNDIIVTKGSIGSDLYHQQKLYSYTAYPATIVNTVGAGDAHLGCYLALTQLGYDFDFAMDLANRYASALVQEANCNLSIEGFNNKILQYLK